MDGFGGRIWTGLVDGYGRVWWTGMDGFGGRVLDWFWTGLGDDNTATARINTGIQKKWTEWTSFSRANYIYIKSM